MSPITEQAPEFIEDILQAQRTMTTQRDAPAMDTRWLPINPDGTYTSLSVKGGCAFFIGQSAAEPASPATGGGFFLYGQLVEDARVVRFSAHGMRLFLLRSANYERRRVDPPIGSKTLLASNVITIFPGDTLLSIFGSENRLRPDAHLLSSERPVEYTFCFGRIAPEDIIRQVLAKVIYFKPSGGPLPKTSDWK